MNVKTSMCSRSSWGIRHRQLEVHICRHMLAPSLPLGFGVLLIIVPSHSLGIVGITHGLSENLHTYPWAPLEGLSDNLSRMRQLLTSPWGMLTQTSRAFYEHWNNVLRSAVLRCFFSRLISRCITAGLTHGFDATIGTLVVALANLAQWFEATRLH